MAITVSRRSRRCSPRSQHGSVAILFVLVMGALLGAAGLAIDLGRYYVIQTELQAAADACALAGAQELVDVFDPHALDYSRSAEAEAVAQFVATQHTLDFQKTAITDAIVTATAPTGMNLDMQCRVRIGSRGTYFLHLFGVVDVDFEAAASAVLQSSQCDGSDPSCIEVPGDVSSPGNLVAALQ